MITNTLQIDLIETPIRVSTIDPGLVETEFSLVRFKGDLAKSKAVYHQIDPLHAEDIAECMEFLVTRPPHVNIHELVVLPRHQANATVIHRKTPKEIQK